MGREERELLMPGGLTTLSGFGLPSDASSEGYRIDRLLTISITACIVLFVLLTAFLAFSVLRYGEKNQAEHDHGRSRGSVLAALGMALFVFVVVDGNLFVRSTFDVGQVFGNFKAAESDAHALRIEVNAHRWAWDARQAGSDGQFNTPDDIVTVNEIRVPVDTKVIFQLAATDVIHSFNLPNFRVKVDAIPGRLSRIWIQGKSVGSYEIGCAQHCGVHHYKMRGRLIVMPKDEYARWAAESSRAAASAFDIHAEDAHWGWPWKEAL